MSTKNLIIAPCGNKALIFKEHWLKDQDQKNFDLCLLFYDEEILHPERYEAVDFFYHLKGFKYPMIHELLTQLHPEWLDQYEYFYLLDDDIEISTADINRLFQLSSAMGSAISCASLTRDSYCSWPIFKQDRKSFCRFVGQIEVMAPLFSRAALQQCLRSFIGNKSSWGMDSVWPKILGYPKDKLIVFDSVAMKHVHPVGGGALYKKLGVSPQVEWEQIIQAYGAKKHNYVEYGRFQLVNSKSSRLYFLYFQLRQFKAKCSRLWRDYDLMSRVRSRFRRHLSIGPVSSAAK